MISIVEEQDKSNGSHSGKVVLTNTKKQASNIYPPDVFRYSVNMISVFVNMIISTVRCMTSDTNSAQRGGDNVEKECDLDCNGQ